MAPWSTLEFLATGKPLKTKNLRGYVCTCRHLSIYTHLHADVYVGFGEFLKMGLPFEEPQDQGCGASLRMTSVVSAESVPRSSRKSSHHAHQSDGGAFKRMLGPWLAWQGKTS